MKLLPTGFPHTWPHKDRGADKSLENILRFAFDAGWKAQPWSRSDPIEQEKHFQAWLEDVS